MRRWCYNPVVIKKMVQNDDLFELIEKLDGYKYKITVSGTNGGMSGGDGLRVGQVFGVDNTIIDLKGNQNLNYLKLLELGSSYESAIYISSNGLKRIKYGPLNLDRLWLVLVVAKTIKTSPYS